MEIRHLTDCVQILWPDRWVNIYPGDPIPEELTQEQKAEVEAMLKDCEKEVQAQVMDAEAENEVFEVALAEAKKQEDTEKKRLMREILIEDGVIPG